MQTKLESATGKSPAAFTRSWIPLIIALIFLPFANGANAVALAAWLAPLFLLRFTRTQKIMVSVPLVLAVQIATLAFQYRGMVPFPTPVYVVVMVFYGLCFTLPYLGDSLLSHRLSVFSGTLVFPLILTSVEYLLSLGPFGSWFSTAYSQVRKPGIAPTTFGHWSVGCYVPDWMDGRGGKCLVGRVDYRTTRLAGCDDVRAPCRHHSACWWCSSCALPALGKNGSRGDAFRDQHRIAS